MMFCPIWIVSICLPLSRYIHLHVEKHEEIMYKNKKIGIQNNLTTCILKSMLLFFY